jgi:hypothetical protein
MGKFPDGDKEEKGKGKRWYHLSPFRRLLMHGADGTNTPEFEEDEEKKDLNFWRENSKRSEVKKR